MSKMYFQALDISKCTPPSMSKSAGQGISIIKAWAHNKSCINSYENLMSRSMYRIPG